MTSGFSVRDRRAEKNRGGDTRNDDELYEIDDDRANRERAGDALISVTDVAGDNDVDDNDDDPGESRILGVGDLDRFSGKVDKSINNGDTSLSGVFSDGKVMGNNENSLSNEFIERRQSLYTTNYFVST